MTDRQESEGDWTDPEFLRESREWIRDRLAEVGAHVNGELEQPHVYWWSTAMRVPTSAGVLWFKAARHTQAFEAALLPVLAGLAPGHTAEPVATDSARGWMLTRDAGTRLREHASGPDQLRCWEQLLPQYAELQIKLAPRAAELLTLGVADFTVSRLTETAERLAADREMLTTAPEDALTEAELDEFRGQGLTRLRELCTELESRGVPDTLQHDDLHDGNLFVRDGRYVFFDWGDACVSHPFHTLVVTLRALAYRQGLAPGAPELLRLRDAYLEAWSPYGAHHELVETADLARRTGTLQRGLAWYRFVLEMPRDRWHEEQDSVPYGVRLFLQDKPWGAWQ